MKIINTKTNYDPELGGTFIIDKKVTLEFNDNDLRQLIEIKKKEDLKWRIKNGHLLEQLLDNILEGVKNYDCTENPNIFFE